ncbi:hypothetical protein D3879_10430 [Pseudomonas cavernicola]|uniref:EthD domain-containing protein n=1 Tax=Pseudomonas cavernicola TaxID=2320866 RepID=A0A418XME6_9PSED|nr:hypothetical protein [Pseudomonas cavernicola]RJG13621.1 hypothetical protein D3879_10430 [Pseudomonas cavernicola]
MFVLSFLYPRPKNRAFDYTYHRNVHLPLGIGLAARDLKLQPKMVWIERIGEDGTAPLEKYAAIAHVLFETRTERDLFSTLFEHADAARRLSVDWECYTEDPPEVRLSEWTLDDDMPGLVKRFEKEFIDLHI